MDPIVHEEDVTVRLSRPETVFLNLSMVAVGSLCFIITVTILSRWVYRSIIPDDVLLVGEMMVAVIILPLAAVSAQKKHIIVTVFTNWITAGSKRKLSALGHLVGILFVSLLLGAGVQSFMDAVGSGEYYDGDLYIPLWIGYTVYILGLSAFLIREFIELIYVLSGKATKE